LGKALGEILQNLWKMRRGEGSSIFCWDSKNGNKMLNGGETKKGICEGEKILNRRAHNFSVRKNEERAEKKNLITRKSVSKIWRKAFFGGEEKRIYSL